jgi:hypothetical protein
MIKIFKPNRWTISLALILFFLSSVLSRLLVMSYISDTFPLGFPVQFFISWGPCPPNQNCSEFNGTSLVFDIIIWYAISALVVFRAKKFFHTS